MSNQDQGGFRLETRISFREREGASLLPCTPGPAENVRRVFLQRT